MPIWTLDASERRALLERFVRYVRIDTQSDENASCSPLDRKAERSGSTAGRRTCSPGLLGCGDGRHWPRHGLDAVQLASQGIQPREGFPVLGFPRTWTPITARPETYVKPQVVHDYAGGDIILPATGATISVAANPNLARCIGHTLIDSDGTTLLGADDKAGVAEIMTMLAWLGQHPELPARETADCLHA